MLSWEALTEPLLASVQENEFWRNYLVDLHETKSLAFEIHLAIFVEPYLRLVLEGRKTIESRFSTRRFPPYGRVQKGDVILLKLSGGPIMGLCQVSNVWFYQLDSDSWPIIRERFGTAICAQDASFWSDRAHTSYATLIRIDNVLAIEPVEYYKRDRRGWVILANPLAHQQLKLDIL